MKDSKETTTIPPSLTEICGETSKNAEKGAILARMESVKETNSEASEGNDSLNSTPSAIHKNTDASISTSVTLPTPQDILTENLLSSSTKNDCDDTNSEDNGFSDEKDDPHNTDEVSKSTEKLYNGNTRKAMSHEIV